MEDYSVATSRVWMTSRRIEFLLDQEELIEKLTLHMNQDG